MVLQALASAFMDDLPGVIVGAAVAGLFTLVGLLIQRTNEHRRWVRERRYEAYRAFLAAHRKMVVHGRGARDDARRDLFNELLDSVGQVELVGPPSVMKAADDLHNLVAEIVFHEATVESLESVSQAFQLEARRVLGPHSRG